jgi:hypothetical protein
MVGATFGLIYVLINAGELPLAISLPLRAAGAVAFLAVLAAVWRIRGVAPTGGAAVGRAGGFGRSYWLVVAAEAAALWAGLAVLNGPLHAPHAGVAWVSTVVGAHFFALAVVFGQRFFHVIGVGIMACGVIGLLLVATPECNSWLRSAGSSLERCSSLPDGGALTGPLRGPLPDS